MEECVQGIVAKITVIPALIIVIRRMMVSVIRYAYSDNQNNQTKNSVRTGTEMEECVQRVVTHRGVTTVLQIIIRKMVSVIWYAYSDNQNDQTKNSVRTGTEMGCV